MSASKESIKRAERTIDAVMSDLPDNLKVWGYKRLLKTLQDHCPVESLPPMPQDGHPGPACSLLTESSLERMRDVGRRTAAKREEMAIKLMESNFPPSVAAYGKEHTINKSDLFPDDPSCTIVIDTYAKASRQDREDAAEAVKSAIKSFQLEDHSALTIITHKR